MRYATETHHSGRFLGQLGRFSGVQGRHVATVGSVSCRNAVYRGDGDQERAREVDNRMLDSLARKCYHRATDVRSPKRRARGNSRTLAFRSVDRAGVSILPNSGYDAFTIERLVSVPIKAETRRLTGFPLVVDFLVPTHPLARNSVLRTKGAVNPGL